MLKSTITGWWLHQAAWLLNMDAVVLEIQTGHNCSYASGKQCQNQTIFTITSMGFMRIACVTGWLGSWAMLDLASWWRMTEIWLAGTACRRTLIGYLALAVWSLSNALISLNCGKTILVPLTALQILHDYLLAKSFSFLRVEDSTSHACPHRNVRVNPGGLGTAEAQSVTIGFIPDVSHFEWMRLMGSWIKPAPLWQFSNSHKQIEKWGKSFCNFWRWEHLSYESRKYHSLFHN